MVLLLSVSLRSARRTATVLLPLAAAVVCTAAILLVAGGRLSIFNLFGLLLVVAVGSNYCLFFERHCADMGEVAPEGVPNGLSAVAFHGTSHRASQSEAASPLGAIPTATCPTGASPTGVSPTGASRMIASLVLADLCTVIGFGILSFSGVSGVERHRSDGGDRRLSQPDFRRDVERTRTRGVMRPSVIGRLLLVASVLCLPGCIRPYFEPARTTFDEAVYASIYPYYAEYCAEVGVQQKTWFRRGSGKRRAWRPSVFYLNGVCRARDTLYPEVALCDDPPARSASDGPGAAGGGKADKGTTRGGEFGGGMVGRGTGFSVNAHFRNANWVATEGRDFFYRGDLAPDEPVTRANYERTQVRAKAMGILDGIVFHDHVFEERPPKMPVRDFKYEVSIATDYGVDLARDRYCARVPLDRARMAKVVRYLNALNAPYRAGEKTFHWQVLRNNCAYLAHNALAAAGLWPEWRVDGRCWSPRSVFRSRRMSSSI